MRLSLVSFPVLSLLAVSFLSGCSGFVDSPGGDAPLSGEVYGGQAPLVGSHVYAFSSSLTGTGGPGIAASTTNASTSLIAATPFVAGYTPTCDSTGCWITTDADGYYEISSSTPCTPSSITYLYTVQGNGGTANNTAAGEMVVLGVCPNGGTLAGSLKSGTTHIHMNEVSTVAAAYALAGFASDATHIGATSATNQTLANTGIQNAGLTAAQMYNYNYAVTNAGDAAAIALATTPNGNGTVPQKTIDSLANSLSLCVGQTAASSGCTNLLGNVKSGGTTGTAATDTATIAIYIAQHPAVNVATVYTNSTSSGNAGFTPALTAQPNDWNLTLTFTGGGLVSDCTSASGCTYMSHPLVIDASGNVWTTSTLSTVLSEFNYLGVPVSSTGYSNSLSTPYGVSIDTSGNAWVANYGSSTLSEFTSTGAVATGSPFSTALTLSGPTDIEFDASGNMWVPNETSGNLNKIKNTVVAGVSVLTLTTSTAHSATYVDPISVAIQSGATGNVFSGMLATGGTTGYINIFTSADAYSTDNTGYKYATLGTTIDSSNYLWSTQVEYYVYHGASTAGTGTPTRIAVNSSDYYVPTTISGVALDGSASAWYADASNGSIVEISSANAILSGTYGLVAPGNTANTSATSAAANVKNPLSIAVDGSGNVWYTAALETGTTTATQNPVLCEIVGAATPVATPLAYGVANTKLAQRP